MKSTFKGYYKQSLAHTVFKTMGLKKPKLGLKIFYLILIGGIIAISLLI